MQSIKSLQVATSVVDLVIQTVNKEIAVDQIVKKYLKKYCVSEGLKYCNEVCE
jgi:hypothetical protein